MGGPAALITALLLAAPVPAPVAQQAPPGDEAPAPRPPGRRRAIDGLAGFRSRSRLVFPGLEERPYLLDALHVFPARARWLLEPWPEDAADPEPPDRRARTLRYRFGDQLWAVDPGSPASQPFEGEELRVARLQLELRRIATAWPADLHWEGEGNRRTTTLEGLGRIEARLGEDGRPEQLASLDPDGAPRERLESIRWGPPREEDGRIWPRSWELHVGERLVWRETLEEVGPAPRVSELLFVPPDRQGPGARVSRPSEAPRPVELPAVARWRRPLTADEVGGWEPALRAAREELARLGEVHGEALSPRPVFELDGDASPVALELRLVEVPETLPEGWELRPAGPAWLSVRVGTDGIVPAALAGLRSALGEGERPGPALLVVQLTGTGAGVTRLLLPYERP